MKAFSEKAIFASPIADLIHDVLKRSKYQNEILSSWRAGSTARLYQQSRLFFKCIVRELRNVA